MAAMQIFKFSFSLTAIINQPLELVIGYVILFEVDYTNHAN
jgi:hypothetical protein